MQSYKIGPVLVNLEKNNQFIPVNLEFEFSVSFEYLVPSTTEEAARYHRNVSRLLRFLQGLNRAFILETEYEETELFVTGRIGNVSLEVPTGCNKMPFVGAFLYHKAQALLEEFSVEEFKLGFNIIESGLPSIDNPFVEITYNDMTYLGSTLEALVDHHEKLWVSEIAPMFHDEDGNPLIDEDGSEILALPWWKRPTGEVRDLINLNIYEMEDEETGECIEGIPLRTKDEILHDIRVVQVMIDEDSDADEYPRPQASSTPPSDDDSPLDSPDSYLNI